MAQLRPCPSCARHVRNSESLCPFCDAQLPAATPPSSTTMSTMNAGRLGRAAIFVAGAALVASAATVTSGCGDDRPKPRDPNTQKPYGAPPADGLSV